MAQLGTLNDTDPGAVSRSLMGGVLQQENNNDLMTEKQIDNLYHLTHSLVGTGMSNDPTYSPIGALGRVATTWLGLHENQAAAGGEKASSGFQAGKQLDLLSGAGEEGEGGGETHDDENHPALNFGKSDVSMDEAKAGIAGPESGGSKNPYALLGPVVAKGMYKGQQAVGKYQVMPGELADQLRVAGLPQMSVEDFRRNPQAQEKLFEANFGQLMQKYGNFNDAASVWFTGRPLARALKDRANDGYTAVGNYVAKANGAIARYRLAQGGAAGGDAMAFSGGQQGQPGNPLAGPANHPVAPPTAAQAAVPMPTPRPGNMAQPVAGDFANMAPAQPGPSVPVPGQQGAAPAATAIGRLLGLSDASGFRKPGMAPSMTTGPVQPPPPSPPLPMPRPAPTAAAGGPPPPSAPGAAAAPGNAPAPAPGVAAGPQAGGQPAQLDTSKSAESSGRRFVPGYFNPKDPKARAALMGLASINPAKAQEIMTPEVVDGDDGFKWSGNKWIGWHQTGVPVHAQTYQSKIGANAFGLNVGTDINVRRRSDGTYEPIVPSFQPETSATGDFKKNAKGYPVMEGGAIDQRKLQQLLTQGFHEHGGYLYGPYGQ